MGALLAAGDIVTYHTEEKIRGSKWPSGRRQSFNSSSLSGHFRERRVDLLFRIEEGRAGIHQSVVFASAALEVETREKQTNSCHLPRALGVYFTARNVTRSKVSQESACTRPPQAALGLLRNGARMGASTSTHVPKEVQWAIRKSCTQMLVERGHAGIKKSSRGSLESSSLERMWQSSHWSQISQGARQEENRGLQQRRTAKQVSRDNVLKRRMRPRMRDRKREGDGTGEVKVALSTSIPGHRRTLISQNWPYKPSTSTKNLGHFPYLSAAGWGHQSVLSPEFSRLPTAPRSQGRTGGRCGSYVFNLLIHI